MPLAIDQLVAKAITQTSGQAAIIPELWAAELEPNLRKREVLQQSVLQNTDLLGEPGDVVHIPTLPDLGAAAALTEGTDMTVGQLTDSTTVDLTPAEVGKAIGITRKALDRIKYDGMAAIVDRLAYSMSLYLEGTIAGLYNATVPVVGGSLTNQYPNSHASGTVVSTDTLDSHDHPPRQGDPGGERRDAVGGRPVALLHPPVPVREADSGPGRAERPPLRQPEHAAPW
jgi:hypothetical protein